MNAPASGLSETLLALRQEFDRSFAQAPRLETEPPENFLAVRVGGDAYALRVAEIGGLFTDRRIMPLPTPMPALLGVAGFRGQIAPVYDLAALLGYARQTAPRWLIMARRREPVALAFDVFDAHFSAFSASIIATEGRDAARLHLGSAVRIGDATRPIIQLQSLLDDIQLRANSFTRTRSGQA